MTELFAVCGLILTAYLLGGAIVGLSFMVGLAFSLVLSARKSA